MAVRNELRGGGGGSVNWNELDAILDDLENAVDGPYPCTITNVLSNCTTSNNATSVAPNSSYSATITANTDYTLEGATVSVTMGGTNITSTAYSNGVITIASVTGDVRISVSAVRLLNLKQLNIKLTPNTYWWATSGKTSVFLYNQYTNQQVWTDWFVFDGNLNGTVTLPNNTSITDWTMVMPCLFDNSTYVPDWNASITLRLENLPAPTSNSNTIEIMEYNSARWI